MLCVTLDGFTHVSDTSRVGRVTVVVVRWRVNHIATLYFHWYNLLYIFVFFLLWRKGKKDNWYLK